MNYFLQKAQVKDMNLLKDLKEINQNSDVENIDNLTTVILP